VPLLLDVNTAREAWPDVQLPLADGYPGGMERARWHIERGLQVFEHYFGFRPRGCWPSEGSVSTATLALLEESGFRWVASGENVLRNSLTRAGQPPAEKGGHWLHRPYHLTEQTVASFFRDDGLSDLIGFTYSDWHADDAVANLVHHLETIADTCGGHQDCVVSIILDGENAWEYYPQNGYYFLTALYRTLSDDPRFDLTTFSSVLEQTPVEAELPALVAGSWVHGTFSTWIGDPDKNRGWEMLCEAKQAFDRAMRDGLVAPENVAAVEHQLAVCEGSDWAWWFGDYNPADTVRDFDTLYRTHLANLYQMMGVSPPEYLSHAFSHGGGGAPATGGVMRRGGQGGT
jgi:alpha-amylase/alpha-mannosidase (GH57 family)